MDVSVDLDIRGRKVTGDTLAPLAYLQEFFSQSWDRREIQEILQAMAFQASLDLEVTKVCQVCLAVRVCPDFLVSLSKVKDSQETTVIQDSQEVQATLDLKERLESLDSLAVLDQGVMMVFLVSLVIPENLVDLVPKERLEIVMVILEVQVLKASQEILATPVDVVTMVPLETMAFQDVQVSLEQRELLVKQDGLESQAPLVSLDQRVRLDTQEEEDKTGRLVYLEVREDLEQKVCLDPPVWMDLMALVDLKAFLEPQVEA